MPLNQSKIIGLPCKISKYYNWGILRKNYFCVLQWGYFHPAMHFQEVFGRYLWNGPSTLKIEKKSFLRPLFRATFPLNTDLNSSSGSLWDHLGPSGTPLGTPLGGPRGSQRTNLSWSSTGKLGIMVRATSLLNSDFNSSSWTLWDPLGGSQKVPDGPRGTQRRN